MEYLKRRIGEYPFHKISRYIHQTLMNELNDDFLNKRILFKSDQPVDIVIYGDQLEGHSNVDNQIFIYDDECGINLITDDQESYFSTMGYLTVLRFDELNHAIDVTSNDFFSLFDMYDDEDDIYDPEEGLIMIKNFVGEIRYYGQVWATGVDQSDFDQWKEKRTNKLDVDIKCRLVLPVHSSRIEKIPNHLFKKMVQKWLFN